MVILCPLSLNGIAIILHASLHLSDLMLFLSDNPKLFNDSPHNRDCKLEYNENDYLNVTLICIIS